jgi:carbamate kinase
MKLLVALGGNAIKQADQEGTTEEQFANCEITAKQLAKIVSKFNSDEWMAVTHGNGPQSGNLSVQMESAKDKVPVQDLDVIGAMTQGQIGYMLQNMLQKHLKLSGEDKDIVAIINQVIVDPDDPEFIGDAASKPVGNFLTEAEAKELKEKHPDYVVKKVKPNGDKSWRRTVPSPIPSANAEARALKKILEQGIIVVTSGGGGIPVRVDKDGNLQGVEAVIDKDRAGEVMAQAIGADTYLILTDVEHALINFGKDNEKPVGKVTLAEMKKLAAEGHFLAGSMGPKVEAAMKFVENGGQMAVISSINKAVDAIAGRTGTIIAN